MAKYNRKVFIKRYNQKVRSYRSHQQRAEKNIPYICLAAFKPIHFLNHSFPTELRSVTDLKNLTDSMHDLRSEELLKRLEVLTEDEMSLVHLIAGQVKPLFRSLSLPAPGSALLNAFYQLRILNAASKNTSVIVEIGPGSGYLTLLLALSWKRRVIAMEITENFYIWQSMLFESFPQIKLNRTFKSKVFETNETDATIFHIPWWETAQLRELPLHPDLIVANHVICEMHELALRHIIKLATTCEPPPSFLIEGEGDQRTRKWGQAVKIFREYGYEIEVIGNNVYIFVFIGTNKTPSKLLQVRSGTNLLKKYLYFSLTNFWNNLSAYEPSRPSLFTTLLTKLSIIPSTHINSVGKQKEPLPAIKDEKNFDELSAMFSEARNQNEDFLMWLQPMPWSTRQA